MRLILILIAAFLTGCTSAPEPERDPTKESWYGQTLEQLTTVVRQAEAAFENHKPDEAAALIQKAEPMVKRVLAVRQPTLAAAEAASDLDHLYGRMLLSNRHYGWARLLFQKNQARWKYWQPATPDTARRLQQAQDAIAECDRHLGE